MGTQPITEQVTIGDLAVTVVCTPRMYQGPHAIVYAATCGKSEVTQTIPLGAGMDTEALESERGAAVEAIAREAAAHERNRLLLASRYPTTETVQIGGAAVTVTATLNTRTKKFHYVSIRATCGESSGHICIVLSTSAPLLKGHLEARHSDAVQKLAAGVAAKEKTRLAVESKFAGVK